MNGESDFQNWIDCKRDVGPGEGFTGAVMEGVRRQARARRRPWRHVAMQVGRLSAGPVARWAVAAVVVIASIIRLTLSMVVSIE